MEEIRISVQFIAVKKRLERYFSSAVVKNHGDSHRDYQSLWDFVYFKKII